jgi:hypothetical protein
VYAQPIDAGGADDHHQGDGKDFDQRAQHL